MGADEAREEGEGPKDTTLTYHLRSLSPPKAPRRAIEGVHLPVTAGVARGVG